MNLLPAEHHMRAQEVDIHLDAQPRRVGHEQVAVC